jgi:aryl-alcohol dehydrogenase-like predicted oxidoreductase
MTKLSLGTVQFGLAYGINNKRGKIPKEEAFLILREAFEQDIHYLDTAYSYGNSEEIIGEFIRNHRIDFKIVSKLPSGKSQNVRSAWKLSAQRLNVHNLYGYLIHSFDCFAQNPRVWQDLIELKDAGKVEKIGFSLYYPKELEYLLERELNIDLVQIPYSIFDQRFAQYLPVLNGRKVEIHTRSVFLQGLVFKDPDEVDKTFSKMKPKLRLLRRLSSDFSVPLSAICLNFVLLHELIDRIVIGVDSLENLKENLQSLKYQNTVKEIYNDLLQLKEDDENLTVPTRWSES